MPKKIQPKEGQLIDSIEYIQHKFVHRNRCCNCMLKLNYFQHDNVPTVHGIKTWTLPGTAPGTAVEARGDPAGHQNGPGDIGGKTLDQTYIIHYTA